MLITNARVDVAHSIHITDSTIKMRIVLQRRFPQIVNWTFDIIHRILANGYCKSHMAHQILASDSGQWTGSIHIGYRISDIVDQSDDPEAGLGISNPTMTNPITILHSATHRTGNC